MSLEIRPITLKAANDYVAANHRHNQRTTGRKWSLACYDGERLCGVAIAGRPIARKLDDGLTDVIWEKLQAEFADDLAWFEARLPYMQKHRRKLERKRKATQRRWAKNKSRRKRQRKFKKKVVAIRAAMETNNEMEVKENGNKASDCRQD